MKVLLATGNHPRHQYLIRLLKENNLLNTLITEERENFIPEPPADLDARTKSYFTKHFENREAAENSIFGSGFPDLENHLRIRSGAINSKESLEFVRQNEPDVLITAGIGILSNDFLKVAPKETWNIHGGLSPWYKGAITHFWPSYLLEPQYTGCTIHYINKKIDAGAMIHQTPAVLEEGDGLQQLASKSLKKGFDEMVPLLTLLKRQRKMEFLNQTSTGKLWLKKDWKPQHLNFIYGQYKDSIVDLYLEGKLHQNRPLLYQQKF